MFNPFQRSAASDIETSQLIFYANQMTSFYTKYNAGFKWVNYYLIKVIVNYNHDYDAIAAFRWYTSGLFYQIFFATHIV